MTWNSEACDPTLLRQLASDRLPEDEAARLEHHLDHCDQCRQQLDQLAERDPCVEFARELLSQPDQETGPYAAPSDGLSSAALDFLVPSEWPGSMGRLGTYEIKGILGRGGMGLVLKAFDPVLNRSVAIKVMSASLASHGAARGRFLREARAAAAVVHEHVISVYAVVEVAGHPFLVMEYVPGGSLQDRLDRHGPLDLAEVLRIGMQTALGLAAAHAQGLVHRDVKPANILLEEGVERVRLTDFGLARALADAAMTQSGVLAGTPYYMSPEQALGEVSDHRSDLFSLGSTLYACCAGCPPFRAESPVAVLRRVSDHAPRPLRELNPTIPDWLERLIGRLMAKEPGQRFQSAAQVAEVFGKCLAHVQQPNLLALPEEVAAVNQTDPRSRPLHARRRTLAAVSLFVATGAVAILWQPLAAKLREADLRPPVRKADTGEARPTAGSEPVERSAPGDDDLDRDFHEAQFAVQAFVLELSRAGSGSGSDPVARTLYELNQYAHALEREIARGASDSGRLPSSVSPSPLTVPVSRSQP